jgi:LysR family hca operon transcriptional activator
MQIEVACEAARGTQQPEKPGFVIGFLLGQEVIWLSESLRILREEAPEVEITLMTKSSPELADGLMQGKIDVALLRREAQTAGLAFKFLLKEPLIAILPTRHRLARHRVAAARLTIRIPVARDITSHSAQHSHNIHSRSVGAHHEPPSNQAR